MTKKLGWVAIIVRDLKGPRKTKNKFGWPSKTAAQDFARGVRRSGGVAKVRRRRKGERVSEEYA